MTTSDKLFATWFCFMFITILYASFGCHDIATAKVKKPCPEQQDTVRIVMKPRIDSLTSKLKFKIQLDTAMYKNEPEMINP